MLSQRHDEPGGATLLHRASESRRADSRYFASRNICESPKTATDSRAGSVVHRSSTSTSEAASGIIRRTHAGVVGLQQASWAVMFHTHEPREAASASQSASPATMVIADNRLSEQELHHRGPSRSHISRSSRWVAEILVVRTRRAVDDGDP